MIALACAAVVALAAALSGTSDKPALAPPPAWARPASIPASPPSSAAPVEVLLSDAEVNFTAGGDQRFTETAVRLQTPQGLAAGNLAINWDPATQSLTIHKVHIIRGGRVIDVLGAGQSFTVLRRETNLERAMLTGILTASLQPEGLQVGDVLDFAYTVDHNDPALQGHSELVTSLPPRLSPDRLRIREIWSRSHPMRWRITPGLAAPSVSQSGGQTVLTISAVRPRRPEPPKGAPARYAWLATLEASDFPDWAGVSSLMAPLFDKASQLAANSPLRGEAARIAAASADPKARAAAALRLVQDQVRYVFVGLDDGGYVPAPADLTWSRRFGDCKGKTALLLALLHLLGIEAEPALVSTAFGDGMDSRLPMLEMFDHVLVRARIDGQTYWLDGTRIGDTSLDQITTPPFHWALPVQSAGATLEKLTPTPPARPDTELHISLDASAGLDALALAHLEMLFRGDRATALRLLIAAAPAGDVDGVMRRIWKGSFPWITPTKVAWTTDPASAEARLTMDGVGWMPWTPYAERSGREYDVQSAHLGFALDVTRDPGPDADAPYANAFPSYQKTVETIVLPQGGAGFTMVGQPVDESIAGVRLQRSARIEAGVAHIETSAETLAPEFPASEAPRAKAALLALSPDPLLRAPRTYGVTAGEIALRLARTPTGAEGFMDRADARIWKGDYGPAIEDLDRAVKLQPNTADELNARCFARAEAGRELDKALADCTAALALAPRAAGVLDSRGLVYFRMGRLDLALADLGEALDSQPSLAPSLYVKGLIERRQGHAAEGAADIAAAIAIDPVVVATYAHFGIGP